MTREDAQVRYDGSACLNLRSVRQACELLSFPRPAGQPIPWSQLASVLWFVETCVTSKKLLYDGTVPEKTVTQVKEIVEQFKAAHEVKLFEVSAITFSEPRKALAAASDALEESRLLFDSFQIDAAVDKPLKQAEHDRFFQELQAARLLPESKREKQALEWVDGAFTGSKCLAAFLAKGSGALEQVHQIYERNATDAQRVTAALINRFRLNYVNQLAAQEKSAYVPDLTFEILTKEHVRLFKDYLVERIIKSFRVNTEDQNILVENMKSSTPLPPIGLYTLMATRASKRPGAILETAYNEFRQDTGLMKLLWSHTKGGIAIKKQVRDGEYYQAIDQYFYDHYRTLEKEAAGIKVLASRANSSLAYLVPAVLKGLAKAIPEAIGLGKVWDVVYSVLRETGVEISIPYLSDRLLKEGCDSYISQYKSLKWDLEHDDAVKKPLHRLSEQVERVFGCPIAWENAGHAPS